MLLLLLVCLTLSTAVQVGGDRLKDHIYTEFQSDAIRACFRRLNGTQEVGCTSGLNGNVGVVQYLNSSNISILTNTEFAPFVVLVDPAIFSGQLLSSLKNSGTVNGVILPGIQAGRWKDRLPGSQSDDEKCPNSRSSFYTSSKQTCGPLSLLHKTTWNPAGESKLWEDWGFPIFLIKDENITESLYQCYHTYNSLSEARSQLKWPLCSVEMKSFMYAAKDSETCWRRTNLVNSLTPQHFCDPLSDNNIFYFATPRNRTAADGSKIKTNPASVIVVAARLDALNMFDKEEIGFDSPSTGIVTLLSTARLVKEALSSGPAYVPGVDNILFLLIQGESFDYIGSSRLVYDMGRDAFPYNLTAAIKDNLMYGNGTQQLLTLDNIKLIIELGQLSNRNSTTIWTHTVNENNLTSNLISKINRAGLNTKKAANDVLPPASSQSFLKSLPSVPVVMLSNFEQEYSNNYFHSIYDSAQVNHFNHTLGAGQAVVQHLTQISEALAKAVVNVATGRTLQIEANASLVNELLHCYTESANCTLYREASEPERYPWSEAPRTTPWPQYVGVHASYHTIFTKQILQYLTGDIVNELPESKDSVPSVSGMQKACLDRNANQNVFKYIFLVGHDCYNATGVQCGHCYRTTVDLTEALSPAFLEPVMSSYDWSSGQYPTWTESIWKTISGRMFLKSNPSRDHATLAIGVTVSVISFLLTYWVQAKADLLFPDTKAAGLDAAPVSL